MSALLNEMLIGASAATSINSTGAVVSTGASQATYSFTNYPIGTASSTRTVIAFVCSNYGSATGRTLSSATIGGINAAIDVQATMSGGGGCNVGAIISAVVPTGTTATISFTFSANMGAAACWAIAVDNLQNAIPHDTMSAISASPISGTIDWLASGVVISGVTTGGIANFTWTGVTEQVDSSFGGTAAISGGYLFPTSSSTGSTISATISGATTRRVLVAASYK